MTEQIRINMPDPNEPPPAKQQPAKQPGKDPTAPADEPAPTQPK